MTKKYRVKLYWEMSAEVEVEAASPSAAAEAAKDGPLPSSDGWEYVADSANVDLELDVQPINP
jgi:hypothetical protein